MPISQLVDYTSKSLTWVHQDKQMEHTCISMSSIVVSTSLWHFSLCGDEDSELGLGRGLEEYSIHEFCLRI